ncbi:MAG: hypothetical protein AAF587_25585 [Bacteroidota bacterium]
MRLFSAIFLALLPVFGFGQHGGRLAFEKFPTIKKTTLLVVLPEGDDAYKTAILPAIQEHWTLMPTEVVSVTEMADFSRNEQFSMLIIDNSERIRHTVDGDDVIRRNHIALYHCNRGEYLKAYGGKEAVTQWAFEDVTNTASYEYKLPGLIQAMHNYLSFLDTAKATEDSHNKKLEVFRNYQADQLKEMTLLLNAEDLPENLNFASVQSTYPYPIESVGPSEIQEAIESKDATKAFLHFGPQYEDIFVIGTGDGTIFYHARPTERLQLRTQDFREMKEIIDSPPVPQATVSERLDKFGKNLQGKFKRKKKKGSE